MAGYNELLGSGLSSRATAKRTSSQEDDFAKNYAKRIEQQAKLSNDTSFYSFQNCKNLSSFLKSPYNGQPQVANCEDARHVDSFVQFRTYTADGNTPFKKNVRTLAELERHLEEVLELDVGSTLVVLRGHQPAKWLLTMGAKLALEPEFYRRHLNFRQEYYSDSSLPSANTEMIQLTATTLGKRYQERYESLATRQKNTSEFRKEAASDMREYLDKLAMEDTVSHGASLARTFSVHDHEYVSLEQSISIYLPRAPGHRKHWIGVVWLDMGCNLGLVDRGPSIPKCLKHGKMPVTYWPTIQHRPGIFFDDKRARLHREFKTAESEIPQTSALLHDEFDVLLDCRVMVDDAYYALSGIFRFIAASESQLLDMLQKLLNEAMNPAALAKTDVNKTMTMWDLLHNKQILDRHIQRLEDTCEFLESKASNRWPVSTDLVAENSAHLVLRDFRKLRRRALKISEDYWKSTTMLTNSAMIDESHKAISQAEGIAKLTTLAFFFVPLTFTTSVFGMNLQELNDGSLVKAWLWALTAVATLCCTMLGLGWFSYRGKMRLIWLRWTTKAAPPDSSLV